MPDAVFGLLFGSFFIGVGLWLRGHEHWALRNDRESYERRPTHLRCRSYQFGRLATRRLAPAALVILGTTTILNGFLGQLD